MISLMYFFLAGLNLHSIYRMLKAEQKLDELLVKAKMTVSLRDRIIRITIKSFCAIMAAVMFVWAIKHL